MTERAPRTANLPNRNSRSIRSSVRRRRAQIRIDGISRSCSPSLRCARFELAGERLLIRREHVLDLDHQHELRMFDLTLEAEHGIELCQRLRLIDVALFEQPHELFGRGGK